MIVYYTGVCRVRANGFRINEPFAMAPPVWPNADVAKRIRRVVERIRLALCSDAT